MQPSTQCTVPLCKICCLQSLRCILCAPIHSKRSTDHLMPSSSMSWYQHPQSGRTLLAVLWPYCSQMVLVAVGEKIAERLKWRSMNRQSYPSDLSDQQWQLLEPLLPPPKPGGRPIKYPRREVMNGILYVLRTGCAWRMLPHDLPPWRTTFHYFRTWRQDGTWERIHEVLRDQLRLAEGRAVSPSAAIIDSQSVKTTEKGDLVAMMLVRTSVEESDTSS